MNIENTYRLTDDVVKKFCGNRRMDNEEAVWMSYLTDPEAIENILPPGLTPYKDPIVALFFSKVGNPNFTAWYWEAILGVYAMHGDMVGIYPVSLILGGDGDEMATYYGRDALGFPKKLGANFVFDKNGDSFHGYVERKGTRLAEIKATFGKYNTEMADEVYAGYGAGAKVTANLFTIIPVIGFEGESTVVKEADLYAEKLNYTYVDWTPGTIELEMKSSPDDSWGGLPVRKVIGGAYNHNHLALGYFDYLMKQDGKQVAPYILKARFDQCMFGDNEV